jgi:hypothetical protein
LSWTISMMQHQQRLARQLSYATLIIPMKWLHRWHFKKTVGDYPENTKNAFEPKLNVLLFVLTLSWITSFHHCWKRSTCKEIQWIQVFVGKVRQALPSAALGISSSTIPSAVPQFYKELDSSAMLDVSGWRIFTMWRWAG